MDSRTVIKCLIEIAQGGKHSEDVIDLLREEFESSITPAISEREQLLTLLKHLEECSKVEQHGIMSNVYCILRDNEAFCEELSRFMSYRLKGGVAENY